MNGWVPKRLVYKGRWKDSCISSPWYPRKDLAIALKAGVM